MMAFLFLLVFGGETPICGSADCAVSLQAGFQEERTFLF